MPRRIMTKQQGAITDFCFETPEIDLACRNFSLYEIHSGNAEEPETSPRHGIFLDGDIHHGT